MELLADGGALSITRLSLFMFCCGAAVVVVEPFLNGVKFILTWEKKAPMSPLLVAKTAKRDQHAKFDKAQIRAQHWLIIWISNLFL